MKNVKLFWFVMLFCLFTVSKLGAQNDSTLNIFQFPANKIPCIDGNTDDWAMVPASYVIGNDKLWDDRKIFTSLDTNNLSIKVKVGWVKGLNRLYFLYEAKDNYWDFSRADLHHDIFELVVDGDRSGSPLIDRFHPLKNKMEAWDTWYNYHGVHAQNYHIFTPAEGMDWCMVWGCQPWIKDLPYANAAYNYNFKPGESGKLTLEFWITPFDYAGAEGPSRAVETPLTENKLIGLGWAIIDFDDVKAEANNGFWNISNQHRMYGFAHYLRAFRLMPLESAFQKKIDADWSFKVIDMDRRLVAFQDKSVGKIERWNWDFGDGKTSTEQHPIHTYEKGGQYIVNLSIEGPDGTSRKAKVWDVTIK